MAAGGPPLLLLCGVVLCVVRWRRALSLPQFISDDDDDIFLSKEIPEEEYMQYIKESIISNKDFNPLDY